MLFEELLDRIGPADRQAIEAARARHQQLTKPAGSLGRLEMLGVRLAGVFASDQPDPGLARVAVFAADHGVAGEGVSAYPIEVTGQMVRNILDGGAAVNVLAERVGMEVQVIDVGVGTTLSPHPRLIDLKVRRGSRNLLFEPAMTADELESAVEAGRSVARRLIGTGVGFLIGGEMGIGNTTPAAALSAALLGLPAREVTGRGTGIDEDRWRRKVTVVEEALVLHGAALNDPVEALRRVGGLEIAALVGFYLEGVSARRAIVLDGFITAAAALVVQALAPASTDYFFAAHLSAERGHRWQLDHLGLEPMLRFDMRLGEGLRSGAGCVVARGFYRRVAEHGNLR